MIILSRLRGLAQFYDDRDDIGFSVAQISRAMDVIDCLTMLGHRILLQVMEELDLFNAFSTWLRFQIDRLASSNANSEELMEKEAVMENGKILTYIQRFLIHSPMALYFVDASQDDYNADWKAVEGGVGLLDMLDTQLKREEEGQPHMKALPQVKFLVDYFDDRASGLFIDIAEAQKRSVRFGQPTKVVVGGNITRVDTIMHHTAGEVRSLGELLRKGHAYIAQAADQVVSYVAVCHQDQENTGKFLRRDHGKACQLTGSG